MFRNPGLFILADSQVNVGRRCRPLGSKRTRATVGDEVFNSSEETSFLEWGADKDIPRAPCFVRVRRKVAHEPDTFKGQRLTQEHYHPDPKSS